MDPTTLNPFQYLERNARTNPSGVFVETTDQKLLNSQALVLVKQIAFELRRLGVRPGHMVVLDLPEFLRILFYEALFHEAAAATVLPKGYVADGIFPVDWILSSSEPTPQRGARVVTIDSHFLGQVEQNPYGISPRDFESGDSLVHVSFSSGTTGRPHAIGRSFDRFMGPSTNDDAAHSWLQGNPVLVLLDTGSATGYNGFYVSVRENRPYLAVGGADAEAVLDLALRNSVTALQGSPAQLAGFVQLLEARGVHLSSVTTVYALGTVMPPNLAARLRAAFDGAEIYNIYGSTEATLAALRLYESDDPFDAGQIFAGSTVQVVDDDGQELPQGVTGRIRHRHPQMVHEYLGDPEATRESFKDGWFYPGDLGYFRPDGGLTLAGRVSEIINAGGVKIDPVKLDQFARANQRVIDAASFAYVSVGGVDEIGLALVAHDDLDVADLTQAFRDNFGAAAPHLVARVLEIPRNAMGKPLRLELAERYRNS